MKQADSNPDKARETILKDLRPVRPLPPPWRRALIAILACVPATFGIVWLFTGLRVDLMEIGPGFSWIASAAFVGAALALLTVLAREVIPGARVPLGVLASGLIFLIAAQIALSTFLHVRHPCPVPEESMLRITVACFGAITLLALPLLIAALYVARKGLVSSVWVAALLSGVVSTVCAEAIWRLHCPFTSTTHLLSSHLPPYVPLIVLGLVVLMRRRRGVD